MIDTIISATKKGFTNFSDFNGRASRPEYWWFYLGLIIIYAIGAFIGDMIESLVALIILLPYLSATARRLHDTNRSGWWQLIVLIPVIGFLGLIYLLVQPTQDENNRFNGEKTL